MLEFDGDFLNELLKKAYSGLFQSFDDFVAFVSSITAKTLNETFQRIPYEKFLTTCYYSENMSETGLLVVDNPSH